MADSQRPVAGMVNPHEEAHNVILERIIKNVDSLNEALLECERNVAEINAYNQNMTIASELWEGYRRNVAYNLQTLQNADREGEAAREGQ